MKHEAIKVTRKYQVTIPKAVRKRLKIEIGDELSVAEKGETIVMKKLDRGETLLDFAGCWEGYPEDPDEFMKELRKLWATWKA